MKKIKLTGLSVFVAITLLTSCKKEEITIKTITETPISTITNEKQMVDTFYATNFTNFEMGFEFYASIDGKITKLGCKMPETGNYIVSLWDVETKSVLAQTQVAVSNTNIFTYKELISSVEIMARKRYIVSVNNTSGGVNKKYYVYYNTNGVDIGLSIYSFTKSKITLLNYRDQQSTIPIFIESFNPNVQHYLVGVADFEFQYNE
ncbi:MAG: DUF4082 domain-containing protein [Chitinophagales bacterium]|nr:DUF4082 domain-containing protein [Chitinophagales bacterium]